MTAETPQAQNPIDIETQQLINVLAQGNSANTAAHIHRLQETYDARMIALVLHGAGQTIGQAQNFWNQLGQQWYGTLQQLQLHPVRLQAQVDQILREQVTHGDGSTSTPA
jgi:hypothetical protein